MFDLPLMPIIIAVFLTVIIVAMYRADQKKKTHLLAKRSERPRRPKTHPLFLERPSIAGGPPSLLYAGLTHRDDVLTLPLADEKALAVRILGWDYLLAVRIGADRFKGFILVRMGHDFLL